VQTILSGGRKIDQLDEFRLAHQFMKEDVVTEAGSRISQSFFRYDRKELPAWCAYRKCSGTTAAEHPEEGDECGKGVKAHRARRPTVPCGSRRDQRHTPSGSSCALPPISNKKSRRQGKYTLAQAMNGTPEICSSLWSGHRL